MKKKHGKEKFFLKFEWLLDKLTLPTIVEKNPVKFPYIRTFVYFCRISKHDK